MFIYFITNFVWIKSEGGPIGLRLSMAVSRIVMGMWDKQLAQLCAESGWIKHLLKRYVDDVTGICETIKIGVHWTMPSPKVANVSDVFGSVAPGGPPGKPTTVGSQGKQPNAANVSNV